MTNLNTARRLARLAGVACLAMPLAAHAEESAGPQIVVTGNAGETSATEESRSAEELRETTTVMTADDSLRYLPSLLVRRRHAGTRRHIQGCKRSPDFGQVDSHFTTIAASSLRRRRPMTTETPPKGAERRGKGALGNQRQ